MTTTEKMPPLTTCIDNSTQSISCVLTRDKEIKDLCIVTEEIILHLFREGIFLYMQNPMNLLEYH